MRHDSWTRGIVSPGRTWRCHCIHTHTAFVYVYIYFVMYIYICWLWCHESWNPEPKCILNQSALYCLLVQPVPGKIKLDKVIRVKFEILNDHLMITGFFPKISCKLKHELWPIRILFWIHVTIPILIFSGTCLVHNSSIFNGIMSLGPLPNV